MLGRRDDTSSDYMQIAARRIGERVFASREFRDASSIGAYYSIRSEVHTHGMLADILDMGKRLYLPRIVGRSMGFGRVRAMEELGRGGARVGGGMIMEPPPGAESAGRLDMILVPAVAASPSGHRLGYGSGHYDRYLAGCRVQTDSTNEYDHYYHKSNHNHNDNTVSRAVHSLTTAVLVLEKQLIKRLPVEPHDVRADVIFTEKRAIRCAARSVSR